MNEAKKRLRKYQEKNFEGRALDRTFDGFDTNAYPETAEGVFLDRIGEAIEIPPREMRDEGRESCDSFRKRILLALETTDTPPDEEGEAA